MLDLKLDRARTSFCRQMARKALRRCADALLEGRPADITRATELSLPGFLVIELEKLPAGVSAIVDIEDRCIGVNHSLPGPAKRFSIAHEIGHVWLEHPRFVFEIEGRQDAILEREANIFAGEFLVPLDALQAAFRQCRDWEQLAIRFDVDREIMYYRFRDTGLLRQVW